MALDHRNKLALCHIPRTGGVSIARALDMEVFEGHKPASYYRKNHPDYHLFAVYRPYKERIESALGYKIPDHENYKDYKGTYKELVDTMLVGRRHGMIVKWNTYFLDCPVDTLIQFNNLEVDLNKMLKALGKKEVTLVPCNSFK